MHYRALQQLEKTDVRFILFPGEPHGPHKMCHQRRKVEEELAWFDKYLFHTTKAASESVKPDSPLDQALRRRSVERPDLRYGRLEKGRLIPETVHFDGLEIGRFEVTHAQYAEFDATHAVAKGHDNYPAAGITFVNAKAYCEWLSKLTGQTYRLPEEEEVKELYEKPAKNENTLDYWAGYAPNPEDAANLRKRIGELAGQAPLLKEVGSFDGIGKDELLFDIGGNVAEWVISKDGTGRPLGGSADQPIDAQLRRREPAREYIGFRVVKGQPKRTAK
jgi:formylglycine-generating enzyme required for sulfatase activity